MGKSKHIEQKLIYSEAKGHADELARLLGETELDVIALLTRIVQYKGLAWAVDCYDAAEKVQSEGGLLVPDGSRNRTFGGVFFHLARNEMKSQERWFIFEFPKLHAKKKLTQKPQKAS